MLGCKIRKLKLKLIKPEIAKDDPNPLDNNLLIDSENLGKIESKFLRKDFIPHSMDLNKYGRVIDVNKADNIITFSYNNVILRVRIWEEDKHHSIQIISQKTNKVVTTLEDYKFDDYFIRGISEGKRETYMKISTDQETVLNIEYEVDCLEITSLPKEAVRNTKILTFDIETFSDDKGRQYPYACGFYDGKKCYTYYLTDFNSSEEMLLKCILDMLKPKYKDYTVYVHNLANFDIYFIHNLLHNHTTVTNLISVDRAIISLTIKGDLVKGRYKSKLVFKDSLKLLPSSLRKLADSFDVEIHKGIFPYSFVNSSNLDYKGEVPDFKFYNEDSETKSLYELIDKTKEWSLKDEVIEYLKKDLISLHQIMEKMSIDVFNSYNINITKYSTISALALALWRTNFMPVGANVSIAKGDLENTIRQAYYGGSVEVIIPYGENLYYYDANSLYPTAMLKPLPVGQPVHSLNKNLNELFGYVKATVTTPPNLQVPILPYKMKTSDGHRLIHPVGTWTGWYFSEELKYAVEHYGYKVTVHESYLYRKGFDVFKDYVNVLGKIKQESTGARREIHKLLLNSLYGRMGLRSDKNVVKIVSSQEAEQILLKYPVFDNFIISEGKEYIRYKPYIDENLSSNIDFDKSSFETQKGDKQVISSIPIAAAVTAWARIIMNPLKSIDGNPFYYGDTDSAILAKPLNPALIGNKIGQFKLEFPVIKEGFFLGSKFYILNIDDDKTVVKCRGYSGNLSYHDFIDLYQGGSILKKHNRWSRTLEFGSVDIKPQTMNLTASYIKRNRIFSLGKWVATSPLVIGINDKISPTSLILLAVKDIVVYKEIVHILALVKYYHIQPLNIPPVIFMHPSNQPVICLHQPLPLIIYIPGNIQLALPAPKTLLALPSSNLIPTLAETSLSIPSDIIYLPPYLPEIIYILASSKHAIEVYDIKYKTTTIYPSIRDAAKKLHVSHSTIEKYIKLSFKVYKNRFIFYKLNTLNSFSKPPITY
jgi:uncharacterized protein YprB with RNaseH-like and TPR domain